jgi:hypothetical protein
MQNQDIISIKNTINNDGFFEIKNFYTENNLKILRNFVDEKLQENKNQYFFLTSKSYEKNLLHDEFFFKNIEDLLKKLTEIFGFTNRKDEKMYKVLRVVTGEKSKKVSLDYHFDAHLLTLLIPIYIPKREGSNNGNLVIYKNLRKITKSILKNICQKLFFQSSLFKKIFIDNNLTKGRILNLEPGNIYIFNGFRTLHTNLEINPNDVRATLLVHYYDLFKESFLVKINRNIRIKKELKNIENNKSKI